jgi:flagellar capping protein FliD
MSLFGNSQQTNGALNLGATSASPAMGANPFAPQGGMMQQMNQNPFMSGMAGGVGMQSGMMGQPMTPPSEMDIQLALMKTLAPMDRFITSAQMITLLQLLNDLVSFSVLEILKNATFVINEDEGCMKMDVASLPANLQTMSAENVTGQFNALQMTSQQNIQQAEMQQQQIAALAQQSMMGGALSAAMADEGFMNKAGGAAGNFMGKMMGMR